MKDGNRSSQKTNGGIIHGSISSLKKNIAVFQKRKSSGVCCVLVAMRVRMEVSFLRMRMALLRIRIRASVPVLPSRAKKKRNTQAFILRNYGQISALERRRKNNLLSLLLSCGGVVVMIAPPFFILTKKNIKYMLNENIYLHI